MLDGPRLQNDRVQASEKVAFGRETLTLEMSEERTEETVKDQVLQDLKPLHFTKWDEIVEAAQNRHQWRGLRRDAMEAATSGNGLPYRR